MPQGTAPCYTELVSATNQLKWSTALEAKIDQLTDSVNPTDYIKKMKKRDPELAKGGVTICPHPFADSTGAGFRA